MTLDVFYSFVQPLLWVGFITFLIALFATRCMIWINIHDTPVHRSSHRKITPRSGGFGIIIGFLLCMGYFLSKHRLSHIPDWKIITISSAILGLIIISLRDDMKGVSLRYKLLTQILVSIAIVASGLSFKHIPLPYIGMLELGALSGLLSLFWVIFLTNAFNFMDGLDGLVSGSSLVASLFCTLIGFMCAEQAFFYMSMGLFFSTLGFFVYNFSPAKIFMGDVGSQFLGVIWSVMLLLSTQAHHSVYTIPLLFFAFIYDVSLTILRRLIKGQSILHPHRTFLFHILHRSGLSHRRISLIYMGFSIIQGLGALYLQFIELNRQILIFIPYLMIMILYTAWVQWKARQHIKTHVKMERI